jgi:hypothetical protein
MSLLDSLLGQICQNVDVASIAGKLGIDPGLASQAIAALGAAHAQPGDTVETAAGQTGIDMGTLSQVAQELGGSEGLGQLSQAMQNHPQAAELMNMIGGGGNAAGGLLGMAEGFFNKS